MAFDSIHNYFEAIQEKVFNDELNNAEDFFADIACVTLNQLSSH